MLPPSLVGFVTAERARASEREGDWMGSRSGGSRRQAWALGVLLLLAATSADAALVGSALVRLTDGAALDASDTVAIGAGVEISAGDGSNIGAVLLPSESLDLGALTIEVFLEEGAVDGTTGYPAGTEIVFSNLDFGDPPLEIVDVGVEVVNITGIALGSGIAFTADSVSVRVDTLGIGEIAGAIDVGTIRLTLVVEPVPEPGPGSLALVAMTALAGRRAVRRKVG